MTWAITRLQEAIVDKFAADGDLVTMTGDGVEDSRGTIHHIGLFLTESGAMERNPFLGIKIQQTTPAIFGTARSHIFRSMVLVYIFDKNECLVNQIADRVQYLLTTPEDDYCNGYYDFSNSHIWNYNTEFQMRMPGGTLKSGQSERDESFVEIVEFEVVWADVACDEIVEPECQVCEIPAESPYDVICYYDYE